MELGRVGLNLPVLYFIRGAPFFVLYSMILYAKHDDPWGTIRFLQSLILMWSMEICGALFSLYIPWFFLCGSWRSILRHSTFIFCDFSWCEVRRSEVGSFLIFYNFFYVDYEKLWCAIVFFSIRYFFYVKYEAL